MSARDGELAEVESLRERFLAACRSPEELDEAQAEPAAETDAATVAVEEPEPLVVAPPTGVVADPALEEPFAPPSEVVADEPATAIAPLIADQEAADATPPPPPPAGYGAFDFGSTHRLQAPEEPGADDATILDGPSRDDEIDVGDPRGSGDDPHEAPTGSFDVPPLPPPVAVGFEDDELSGATRILARPRLVEMESGVSGREHALALGRTSIGRASDNVVHLLDEAVSRHHAEVVPGPRGYLLRDLGSENGIYVNGERSPEHVLRDGDVIQIGARTLVFQGA